MLHKLLYTEREYRLYSLAMRYLVSGVRPLLVVLSFLVLTDLWLLRKELGLSGWFLANIGVCVFSVGLLAHLQWVIKTGSWFKKENSGRAGLMVCTYIILLYTQWYVWLLYAYAVESPIAHFLVILATISGLLSVAASISFIRLLVLSTLIAFSGRNLVVVLFFPELWLGNLAVNISDSVILSFAILIYKKTLDSLELQVSNEQLLAQTEENNDALQQITRTHSHYLSAASHDLRQPLHALALILNDVGNKNKDVSLNPTISNMNIALDNLVTSFESMQRLSQLDSGLVKPKIEVFPIQRLFDKIHAEYAEMAQIKGLKWRMYRSRLVIESDEHLLLQVLGHMVANAIAKTTRGGVLVGVRRIDLGGGRQSVGLAVYDTGEGLTEVQMERFFNPNQGWHNLPQRQIGGVGLGFAIANRLSKLLNAKLIVKSRHGVGSCFGMALSCPIAYAEQEHEPSLVVAQSMTLPRIGSIENKRIVILDDNQVAADELEALLMEWGAQVSMALSSEMLAELFEEEGAFDVIISDYHLGLPDETGLDCIFALRALQKDTPLQAILVSGDTSIDLEDMVQQNGIHMLHKPIRPARFRSFLQRILSEDV